MTKLSLFIWLADAIEGINGLFVAVGIITLLVLGILILIHFITLADCDVDTFKLKPWWYVVFVPIAVLSLFIACLIPSKKTLYMIAGVELANTVMQSEDFQKVKSYLGETGVQMIDDIKSIIHKEAMDAMTSDKKEKNK